jgi:hypothetical protein
MVNELNTSGFRSENTFRARIVKTVVILTVSGKAAQYILPSTVTFADATSDVRVIFEIRRVEGLITSGYSVTTEYCALRTVAAARWFLQVAIQGLTPVA